MDVVVIAQRWPSAYILTREPGCYPNAATWRLIYVHRVDSFYLSHGGDLPPLSGGHRLREPETGKSVSHVNF